MPGARSLEAIGLNTPLGSGLCLAAVAAVYNLLSAAQNLQNSITKEFFPSPFCKSSCVPLAPCRGHSIAVLYC